MNDDEGAVLSCEGSPAAIEAAFDAVFAEVGYARSVTAAEVDVSVATGERVVAFSSAELKKTMALAVARRIAHRLKTSVRVFTVRLVDDGERSKKIDCELDEVVVRPDGSSKPGRWGEDTTAMYGSDWGQVCDGKAYFAVSSLLDDARETALPDVDATKLLHFRAPPSLGSPRLDELAKQARLADKAAFANVAGRACIRITTGGATVTSFLEPLEADALREALGSTFAKA